MGNNTIKYPAIPPQILDGNNSLIDTKGNTIARLSDFWSWAYSDLLGNTERGDLAEYIVACALGIQNKERIPWNKYDSVSPEGITIEIKTSGYLQTWGQKKLSLLNFGIRPTKAWDRMTNDFDTQKRRQADIYIFCVHKHKDQNTVNSLDINQWDFYILPSKILDEKVGNQKSISLTSLLKIGAKPCSYDNLHKKIIELSNE